MEKLRMTSPDLTARNIEKIAELFPNVLTETLGQNGEPKAAIDFDLLRQELSDHVVEGPAERYQLNWPGKRQAAFAANAPIAKTLRPVREESVNFDETKNLFIEGDNLEVLKLLQESYLGKIKLIYIDPPYNTGKDFVFQDNFFDTKKEYLQKTEQINEKYEYQHTNIDISGKRHSNWLSMIYPRIKLARNLLSDNGVILVSIDDSELQNILSILHELFGTENHIATFIWISSGNIDQASKIKNKHEYILAFAKNEKLFKHPEVIDPNQEDSSKVRLSNIVNSAVKNGPKNPKSIITLPSGFPADFEEGTIDNSISPPINFIDKAYISNFTLTNHIRVESGWSSRTQIQRFIDNNCTPILDSKGRETRFELTRTGAINYIKNRTANDGYVTSTLFNFGSTEIASNNLKKIGIEFSYPKPVDLISFLISSFIDNSEDNIVLDFFAGSGTTGESCYTLNTSSNSKVNYILVQFPEKLNSSKQFSTVSDICQHRLQSLYSDNRISIDPTFEGFRKLILDTSSRENIFSHPSDILQQSLDRLVQNIKADRSAEDLLFQVMLEWGLELSLPIKVETVGSKVVHIVADGALAACFDREVSQEVIDFIAELKPERAVFREDGFPSDDARINVEQVFKQVERESGVAIDVKVI